MIAKGAARRFRDRPARRPSAGGLVAGVAAVMVACFLILAALASHKATITRRGWVRSLGSYEEMLQRHPPSEANASALELERLSARLWVSTPRREGMQTASCTRSASAGELA